ncbi:MAG: hypothetical protein AB1761_08085 [Pseudomonadota bacterium]
MPGTNRSGSARRRTGGIERMPFARAPPRGTKGGQAAADERLPPQRLRAALLGPARRMSSVRRNDPAHDLIVIAV